MAVALQVEDLSVGFPADGRWTTVVRGVSFQLQAGEFVGLVGESGSGKSMTALALMRLIPWPGKILGGSIHLEQQNLLELPESQMRRVRGARVGYIFQEPMSALNPVLTVGHQIAEAVRTHRKVSRRNALQEAERLLTLVAIPDAASRLKDYPHQISGGQRQRVMIAIALASRPQFLIADEPTTALDVTIQAQILELLEQLRVELNLGILLITHDLAVVAETCARVLVMYAGEIVESAPVAELFAHPAHPYSRGLLSALPKLGVEIPRGGLPTIPGGVPDIARLPGGCPFHPRCSEVLDQCSTTPAAWLGVGEAHFARCHLWEQPA